MSTKSKRKKKNLRKRKMQRIAILVCFVLLIVLMLFIVINIIKKDEGKGIFVAKKERVAANLWLTEDEVKTIVIPDGTTIGDLDVSGLTVDEASAKIDEYVAGFTNKVLTLSMDENKADVTVGELGLYWKNREVVLNTLGCETKGSVIDRYKKALDTANGKKHYELDLNINKSVMSEAITNKCGIYNVPHVDASLSRENGEFVISPESNGRIIDMDESIKELTDYIENDWNGENGLFELKVIDDIATATTADCELVTDILGSFSTTFSSGSSNRNKNMENGVRLLNGITIYPGETLSVNSHLEPWTEDNGWANAGTYVNGQVEDSLGGGICQVSTTLYNAALFAELNIVERSNHSLTVGYVPLSQDAALAGTWKDLKLENNTDAPIYIEGIYESGRITFRIYGHETRDASRTLNFVSETLETIPYGEEVTNDPTKPAGYREVVSSGHTGYKARLKKQVLINGVVQSEEIINTSTYAASNAKVIVGTGEAVATESSSPAEGETTTAPGETTIAPENPSSAAAETTKPQETTKPEATTQAAAPQPQETTSPENNG